MYLFLCIKYAKKHCTIISIRNNPRIFQATSRIQPRTLKFRGGLLNKETTTHTNPSDGKRHRRLS